MWTNFNNKYRYFVDKLSNYCWIHIHRNPHVKKSPISDFIEVMDGPTIEDLLSGLYFTNKDRGHILLPFDKKTHIFGSLSVTSANFYLACIAENMMCAFIYLVNNFPRLDIKFPGNWAIKKSRNYFPGRPEPETLV